MRSLHRNCIGDKGCSELAEALKVNTSLQWLEYVAPLATTGWRQHQHQRLCSCSQLPATAACLSLHWNKIGDDGCSKLAEALAVNSTLRTLSYGCAHASALPTHPSSAAVSHVGARLSENPIGTPGSVKLAEALGMNSSLRVLECVSACGQ